MRTNDNGNTPTTLNICKKTFDLSSCSIVKYTSNLGEWLNGRVVVSKTIGCVFESRLPCQSQKKRSSSALFALQESRDCIRKFLRMQKLRVTLAVVLMCNFLKAKSLMTVRSSKSKISYYCSLAIPSSLRLSLRIASPLPKPKKRSSSALFALQENRDCIRKFLRMQKLRVTLAVVSLCNLQETKSPFTARSLFRPHFVCPYESRLPCQSPKSAVLLRFSLFQENRDCIRKFFDCKSCVCRILFECIACYDENLVYIP